VVDGNNMSEREAIARRRIFPQSRRLAREGTSEAGWSRVGYHVMDLGNVRWAGGNDETRGTGLLWRALRRIQCPVRGKPIG
jgi:hypothetical protein